MEAGILNPRLLKSIYDTQNKIPYRLQESWWVFFHLVYGCFSWHPFGTGDGHCPVLQFCGAILITPVGPTTPAGNHILNGSSEFWRDTRPAERWVKGVGSADNPTNWRIWTEKTTSRFLAQMPPQTAQLPSWGKVLMGESSVSRKKTSFPLLFWSHVGHPINLTIIPEFHIHWSYPQLLGFYGKICYLNIPYIRILLDIFWGGPTSRRPPPQQKGACALEFYCEHLGLPTVGVENPMFASIKSTELPGGSADDSPQRSPSGSARTSSPSSERRMPLTAL